ncbi:unnamed protein product [Arabidopsis arenosa]|uniref:Uncharacterized protein n=1 Tax=Arabidopsis arenosa TaxID=38785 RepID=A0A8S2A5U8_ARAAE|nr:unnamed protein product [Arabidopsis arenosa]
MGTRGMCFSFDCSHTKISIPKCELSIFQIIPLILGTIMAMGRLNRAGIMVYGGTSKPGHL